MLSAYELFISENGNTTAPSQTDEIETGIFADRGRADGQLNLFGNMAVLEGEAAPPPPEQQPGCIYVAY